MKLRRGREAGMGGVTGRSGGKYDQNIQYANKIENFTQWHQFCVTQLYSAIFWDICILGRVFMMSQHLCMISQRIANSW